MKPIPKRMRQEMEDDPFYRRCCITKTPKNVRKVDWHHNMTWQGSQLNEKFAILPVVRWLHDIARRKDVSEILDWVMLNRATDEQLEKYSKATDYKRERDRLNNQFGIWPNEKATKSFLNGLEKSRRKGSSI